MCVTRAGELWTFGRNDQSQCGLGKDAPPIVHRPAWVEALSPGRPGNRGYGQTDGEGGGGGGAGRVVSVAAGPAHSLAVTSDGAVYSWGVSREGVLGHGSEVRVWGTGDGVNPIRPRRLKALACGFTRWTLRSLTASRVVGLPRW